MKQILLTAIFVITLFHVQAQKPKNVIFLIGDGMGLAQVSTTFYYSESSPNFQRFMHIGLAKTSSASHRVTDSAAGATALASGIKTYNRAIGVNTDSLAVPTILEELKQKDYKTGLITLCTITHATPACFYAHVKDRDEHEEIARQLTGADLDFFAGAGSTYFTARKDGRNLFTELQSEGYIMDSVQARGPFDPKNKYGFLLAPIEMPAKIQGRDDFLPRTTREAIDYLNYNKTGFFLMSEGSYIDWGGHSKNAEMVITEQLDFDQAVGVALDFAEKDGNTLVLVTADHETGGLALEKGASRQEISLRFTTDQHTTSLVPVFAYGPGAENFAGIYENNEIQLKLRQLLGL